MPTLCSPWTIAPIVLLINVPFGYWRARSRKFSLAWFAAVHVPVLIAIALRLALGIAFRLSVLPLYVLAFAAGQATGGWIRSRCGGS
jgi:hypothetical protein